MSVKFVNAMKNFQNSSNLLIEVRKFRVMSAFAGMILP